MTLEIRLGIKKEKRLMRHLKMEHPNVRGNIRVRKFGNRRQIDKIILEVPDFEEQAKKFTKTELRRRS